MKPPGQNSGWYDDPTGNHLLRYWDGTKWTSHVQTAHGGNTTDEIPPPPPTFVTREAQDRKLFAPRFLVIGLSIIIFISVVSFRFVNLTTSEGLIGAEMFGSFSPPKGHSKSVEIVWHGYVASKTTIFDDVRVVPLIVRNNTNHPVHQVAVSAEVRSPDGSLLEGSEELSISPSSLDPGQIGVGSLEIKNLGTSEIGSIKYKVRSSEENNCSLYCAEYAQISEVSQNETAIRGRATAIHYMTGDPIGIHAYVFCFSSGGYYLGTFADELAIDQLDKSESSVFVVDVKKNNCPNFAIWVS